MRPRRSTAYGAGSPRSASSPSRSHGVFGLIGVSYVLLGQDRRGDAVLLTLMSGVVALIVCAATRAILGTRPFSATWSLVALVPTVAALVLLF